jgi:hypothetical protein
LRPPGPPVAASDGRSAEEAPLMWGLFAFD